LPGQNPINTSVPWFAGRATVDGVDYDSVWFGGLMKVSGTVVVPAVTTPQFTVTFPFVVEDNSALSGYPSNPFT